MWSFLSSYYPFLFNFNLLLLSIEQQSEKTGGASDKGGVDEADFERSMYDVDSIHVSFYKLEGKRFKEELITIHLCNF